MKLTHSDLVAIGERWLKNTMQCGVVIAEGGSRAKETPDVIGWKPHSGASYLIECKTSKSDFKDDMKKSFRKRDELGMGSFRFYLTEPGLVTLAELPIGWGLLETSGKRVSRKVFGGCNPLQRSIIAEHALLLSEVRLWNIAAEGKDIYPSPRMNRILRAMGREK